MEFSKNKKLNGILTSIYKDLKKLGIKEVKRYYKEFPNEIDYNIANHGNMLVYYYEVKKLYKNNGYKNIDEISDEKIWELYKTQVGEVVRIMLCTLGTK